MDTHDDIQSEYEVNRIMLRKYITKHYRIYKVFVMDRKKPISFKNPLKFEMFEETTQKEVNTYHVFKLLMKIFSITEAIVKKITYELAIEEFDRIQKLQIELFDERNSL